MERNFAGTPGAIRTHDTRFRKPLLYPSELQGLGFRKAGANEHMEKCTGLPFPTALPYRRA